ncbi:hypothetical protein ACS0TY_026238 [Phlomoides rotata]
MKHMDIVQDILHYSCEADIMVWHLKVHGTLSARGAYCAAQQHFPEVSWALVVASDGEDFQPAGLIHLEACRGYYANVCRLGCIQNTVFDLLVLSTFGIKGRPLKAPSAICIWWQPPLTRFVKVNVDGGAAGAPGRLTGGGVYRDSFGVFRGCFAMQHGSGFAFEAKLATTFSAVEIAFEKRWLHIWLESDSIYVVTVFKNRNSLVPWRLLG